MPVCGLCKKTLKSQAGLSRHSREVHAVRLPQRPRTHKIVCHSCSGTFPTNGQLIEHIADDHGIKIMQETLSFESKASFLEWKRSLESHSSVKFVIRDSAQKRGKVYTYYYCSRYERVPDSDRKGDSKTRAYIKIYSYCPARMQVTEFCGGKGKVDVKFISTHFGHDLQLADVPVPSPAKAEIPEKLARKIPLIDVLDEGKKKRKITGRKISSNRNPNNRPRKDLYNIKRDFKLNADYKHHSDDATSINIWVKKERQFGSPSCVLFYKEKGLKDYEQPGLQSKDFFLAVMTAGQQEIMTKFGINVVCMDSTQVASKYGNQLTTISVVDDLGQVFPCAFCLTNRYDTLGMTVFLSKVKEKVGNVQPRTFMSDTGDICYNAWKDVMGECHFRLYCTWQVVRAWETHMSDRVLGIKSETKREETSKILRSLQMETRCSAFEAMLPSVIQTLKTDEETKTFGQYFEKMYGSSYRQWAYCYRRSAHANTDMSLEKMHGDLKHIFICGRKARRKDKTIHALMRLINKKLFDRLIALEKGKVSSKLEILIERHETSLSLNFSRVVPDGTVGSWTVFSSDTTNAYTVALNPEPCSCQLYCRRCSACIHKFLCTCIDSCINYNMCKHVHLVARFILDSNGGSYTEASNDVLTMEDEGTSDSFDAGPLRINDSDEETERSDDEVAPESMKRAASESFKRLLRKYSSRRQVALLQDMLKAAVPQLEAIKTSAKGRWTLSMGQTDDGDGLPRPRARKI